MRAAIIGAALALLAGCSALRVAYSTGPQLAWWWIDGYFDFTRDQSGAVRPAIERWFDWHRGSQLPEYVALLASLQASTEEAVTPAQVCRWYAVIRERLDPAIDRALVQGAELVPLLGREQFEHLEKRYAKNLDQMREEYLQADPTERAEASLGRALKRVEQLYGRLGEAQRKAVAAGVVASPFDPQAWHDERRQRQRDLVQTLRRLVAEKADRDGRLAALRALAERTERSPDPAYRAYQQRLLDYNCAFFARIHNATTPAQRARARETLKGWEEDLKAVSAVPISG